MTRVEAPAGGASVELAGVRFAYPGGFSLAVGALAIAPGEQVALVGPSGSGKTTLLALIAGTLSPAAGTLRVAGRALCERGRSVPDAERRRRRLREMGLMFQELELVEHLTARENALLSTFFTRHPRAELDRRLEDLAQRLGLASKLDRKPDALSQGERQRVALCRALVTRPPLLLVDEPTANLDRKTAARVFEVLTGAARASSATLLCVTHDPTGLPAFERVLDLAELAETSP